MADRVYPVDQRPLRVPTDLSDVPLYDDEKAPSAPPQNQQHRRNKDQVEVVCQAPPAQQKAAAGAAKPRDVIYKMPAPLPANHPSVGKRRRLSPCCCCLAWLCSLLIGLVILIVIAALVFYLVVQPRVPKYDVQDLRVSRFNLSNQPLNATARTNSPADAPYLNSEMQITIYARNPNKKIGLYYDELQVYVTYEAVQIGQGSIPPFYQGHKNTTLVSLDLKGNDVALKQSVGANLNQTLATKGNVPLQIETIARVASKLGSWKSSDMKARVLCSVEMSAPVSGTARVVSQSCKLNKLS